MSNESLLVRPGIVIPGREFWFEFSHSSGPGGQNVNKVATAAALCFCPAESSAFTPEQKETLRVRLAGRINSDGILRITATDTRSQLGNKALAIQRFRTLLAHALESKGERQATTPTRASRERRLENKRIRSLRKAFRARITPQETE